MATTTISLERRTRLPRLCIVCGSKDCDFERVTLRPSVGSGGMVALASRTGYSTVTVTLPLCGGHRYHFALQTILRYLAIAAALGVGFLGLVVLAIFNRGWIIGVTAGAVLAVVAVWFVLSMVMNKSRVHICGFDGDDVVFANVSLKFAQANEPQSDDDDDERVPRKARKPGRREEPQPESDGGDFNFT